MAPALLSVLAAGRAPEPGTDAAFALQVRSKNGMAVAALAEAGRAAAERLAEPGCARIFSEFRDASGLTLQQRLDALGRSGSAHLQAVYFYDGADTPSPEPRTPPATRPSAAPRPAAAEFVLRQRQDPDQAPAPITGRRQHHRPARPSSSEAMAPLPGPLRPLIRRSGPVSL